MRSAIVAVLSIVGCVDAADVGAVDAESGGAATIAAEVPAGACYDTFSLVLYAWEDEFGEVEDECAALASTYKLHMVSDVPCETTSPNSTVFGCTLSGSREIYLLADTAPKTQAYVSAHEWVHALSDCVDGDSDHDHRRAVLWVDVLGIADDELPDGDCIGPVTRP